MVKLTTLTDKQIKQIKQDAIKEAIEKVEGDLKNIADNSVRHALSLSLLILHDKFGFGRERLQRVVNEVKEYYDSCNKGYVTLDDIEKVIDELGVKR